MIATGPVALLEESLALGRRGGDQWLLSIALNNLGNLLAGEGDYERAAELFEESLAIGEARGDLDRRARALNNLGWATHGLGDLARARDYYRRGLEAATEIGLVEVQLHALFGIAALEAEAGDAGTAARLLGQMKELDVASRCCQRRCARRARAANADERSRLRSGPSGLRPSLRQGPRCRSRTRSTSRSDEVIRQRPAEGRR